MESRRFQDSDLEDIHFGSRKFQKRKGGGGGGGGGGGVGGHLPALRIPFILLGSL